MCTLCEENEKFFLKMQITEILSSQMGITSRELLDHAPTQP